MDQAKAHNLARTIIQTHSQALRIINPSALSVLDNAVNDIQALISEIYEEHRAELAQAKYETTHSQKNGASE